MGMAPEEKPRVLCCHCVRSPGEHLGQRLGAPQGTAALPRASVSCQQLGAGGEVEAQPAPARCRDEAPEFL